MLLMAFVSGHAHRIDKIRTGAVVGSLPSTNGTMTKGSIDPSPLAAFIILKNKCNLGIC